MIIKTFAHNTLQMKANGHFYSGSLIFGKIYLRFGRFIFDRVYIRDFMVWSGFQLSIESNFSFALVLFSYALSLG